MRKCKTSDFKISEAMVEELVNALGKNADNKIDYKTFVEGRTSHLSDRRFNRKGIVFISGSIFKNNHDLD